MGQASLSPERGIFVPVGGLGKFRTEILPDFKAVPAETADYAMPEVSVDWTLSASADTLITDKRERKVWTNGLWEQAQPLLDAGYSIAEVVETWEDGSAALKAAVRRSFAARLQYQEARELIDTPDSFGRWGELLGHRTSTKRLDTTKKTFALLGVARSLMAERRRAMGVIQSDYENRELDPRILFRQLDVVGQLLLDHEAVKPEASQTSRSRRKEAAWYEQLNRLSVGRQVLAFGSVVVSAMSGAALPVLLNLEHTRNAMRTGESVGLLAQAIVKLLG
jgi:hypothetical protein